MVSRNHSVVVFGGSGLLGSSIKYYLRKYHNDNYLYFPTRAEVDLLSFKAVVSYLKKLKPEFVINAAGYVGGIDRVRRDPYDFLVKNIDIDLNILKACVVVPNTSLIGFSSIIAFGQLPNTLVDESCILRGRLSSSQEPYALAKGVAAKAFDFARSQYKINATTIILEQLYGPKDHFFGDKAHMLPSAVRKICDAKTENSKNVEIWGNGEAKRSYTFAPDVALFVAKNLIRISNLNSTFNLGSNNYMSINEYYALIAERANFTGLFTHDLTKPDGVDSVKLNTQIAERLGWLPETSIEHGIDQTVEHYRKQIQRR